MRQRTSERFARELVAEARLVVEGLPNARTDVLRSGGFANGNRFHHRLGIGPILHHRWLEPLRNSADPVAELKTKFRALIQEDIASGHFVQGCPLNNLAQEMSPLDNGFHTRIDKLYSTWRKGFANALASGGAAGTVRANVAPRTVAALLVAGQMGIWGTGKSSQNKTVVMQATDAMCDYLDSLKA